MAIAAWINDALGIRTQVYSGALRASEVFTLAAHIRANPGLVKYDVLHLVDESFTRSECLAAQIDAVRDRFRALHTSSDMFLVRRSAWVCSNRAAWALLESFLRDRHSHDGQGSELCLVATLREANCLFDEDELEAVSAGGGLRPLFSIDHSAPSPAKAA